MSVVSPFKNANGVRRLSSLFQEMCRTNEDKETALYTLKDHDHKQWKSLYRLYIQENDPLEYNFAMKHMGDWQHWQILCEAQWFKPYIERWRAELELSIKSAALARLIEASKEPTRDGLTIARFLVEKGWAEKPTKGRPSKEQISDTANKIAQERIDLSDHMSRVGLIANNGFTKPS